MADGELQLFVVRLRQGGDVGRVVDVHRHLEPLLQDTAERDAAQGEVDMPVSSRQGGA